MSNDTQMRVRSITEGAILPSMIKFAIPLILMGVLQMLYSTADSLVVGIMGGKDSLAAVGATGSIMYDVDTTLRKPSSSLLPL